MMGHLHHGVIIARLNSVVSVEHVKGDNAQVQIMNLFRAFLLASSHSR